MINSLILLGKGMLALFISMLIIFLTVKLLTYISKKVDKYNINRAEKKAKIEANKNAIQTQNDNVEV